MHVNDSPLFLKLKINQSICTVEVVSETAAKILVEKGFENVYFLKGGVQKSEKKEFFLIN